MVLDEYGPATAEELARHLLQPPTFELRPTLQPPEMRGLGLQIALGELELEGKAISVTTGRKKRRQTLWMTPRQARELMNGIQQALE